MFLFHHTKRSYTGVCCFNARAGLASLALASILLSAAAATGSSSQSKSSASQKTPAPQPATARPEVVIGETRRDCGDVFTGEELEQSFAVRNAGTAPLELAQKSSLGLRSGERDHPTTAAARRANDLFMARRVAARLAAPT